MTDLVLERKDQPDETAHVGPASITPPISTGYWSYRVAVSANQAIVAFPKFSTVGIGFQIEEDWNTNLPFSSSAEEILDHIWHNRGPGNDGAAFRARCLEAIRLIQAAVTRDRSEHA